MLRRQAALNLGQKSVQERNHHSQTETGWQNSTNKKTDCIPEEAKLTHNYVEASKELRGKQKTTKCRSYLTLYVVQRVSWHCTSP